MVNKLVAGKGKKAEKEDAKEAPCANRPKGGDTYILVCSSNSGIGHTTTSQGTFGNDAEANSQPQAPTTFVIPVPPPMPKTFQPLRPKQRIFRPLAFLSDVRFSTHPAQPPQQQPPIPQVQPPVMSSTSNSDAISQGTTAAARGATTESLFNFMPTPNFKPPTQE
ncbi:hypothetical protein PIB30_056420 [Stylosanthes scabra]|uniref:Uncharacterized protein n=1 Tax=Stylosanthes scabra TaxID=79078 RepID=A0ABU6QK42_9FABA|nr:hypothetical protein [Stylosanthes scabra]